MTETRYMVMNLLQEEGEFRHWLAVTVDGVGCALTREQAETLLAQQPYSPRFLFPYTEQTKQFGEEPRRPLVMLPGETIWTYGEPAYVDMGAVLREALSAGPDDLPASPDPEMFPVLVESVVATAVAWFGEADPHDVEAAFDALVIQLGGIRHDDPPHYGLPLAMITPY
jgi:hypothetical protein